MKTKIIVIALIVAFLTADLIWSLRRNELNQWLVTFVYILVLMVVSFFKNRWILKQHNQLKARYRVTNISMWIFFFLAAISVIPNIFIAGNIDKTVFWPLFTISFVLFGMCISSRKELLHELTEREKTHPA